MPDALPASWLTDHAHLLPAHGDALDIASGSGRHARWLAARGFAVTAIDRDVDALSTVQHDAESNGLPIVVRARDLETSTVTLGHDSFDVIVTTHYLHRPLFPAIISALRPGGILVYETFTREQATIGRPTNPAFLLEPGELLRLVRPLTVLASREGLYNQRFVASIVARKPPAATVRG